MISFCLQVTTFVGFAYVVLWLVFIQNSKFCGVTVGEVTLNKNALTFNENREYTYFLCQLTLEIENKEKGFML